MVPLRNLTLLLDFDEQYHRDQQQDEEFLHRRDRQLAVERGIDGSRRSLTAWLGAVRGRDCAHVSGDPRLRVWGWLRALFIAAGVIFGAAAMLGLLYYDGGRRISVTLIMAVALLQLLLALITAAQSWIGWQPWRGVFRDVLARASNEPRSMLRALAVPLAARVAQSGGLAFGLAAFVVLLGQVVVHDLVFGWSTTLQASAPAYHQLTTAVAWPWRSWLPEAVPSLHLVEQSRYFSVGTHVVSDPEMLGIWWRFLAMLWLSYVVVPRIVLLGLACLQLVMRVRRLLADHPGRAALHARCTTPWVDSGEGAGSGRLPASSAGPSVPPAATPGRVLIRWADAGDARLAHDWLGADAVTLSAGGAATLDQDQASLDKARTMGGPVIIVARGWEPPTGELADFIERAGTLPGNETIQLLPLAAGSPPSMIGEPALAPWRRFVERLQASAAVVVVDVPGKEIHP